VSIAPDVPDETKKRIDEIKAALGRLFCASPDADHSGRRCGGPGARSCASFISYTPGPDWRRSECFWRRIRPLQI